MPVDCTVLPLCVNTLVHIGDFYLDTKEISIQLTFRTQYQPENLIFNTCDAQDKYLNKAFNVSSYTTPINTIHLSWYITLSKGPSWS